MKLSGRQCRAAVNSHGFSTAMVVWGSPTYRIYIRRNWLNQSSHFRWTKTVGVGSRGCCSCQGFTFRFFCSRFWSDDDPNKPIGSLFSQKIIRNKQQRFQIDVNWSFFCSLSHRFSNKLLTTRRANSYTESREVWCSGAGCLARKSPGTGQSINKFWCAEGVLPFWEQLETVDRSWYFNFNLN